MLREWVQKGGLLCPRSHSKEVTWSGGFQTWNPRHHATCSRSGSLGVRTGSLPLRSQGILRKARAGNPLCFSLPGRSSPDLFHSSSSPGTMGSDPREGSAECVCEGWVLEAPGLQLGNWGFQTSSPSVFGLLLQLLWLLPCWGRRGWGGGAPPRFWHAPTSLVILTPTFSFYLNPSRKTCWCSFYMVITAVYCLMLE